MQNKVKQLINSGNPAFGVHVKFPAAAAVDVAGITGFDFVKFDPYHWHVNRETLDHLIRAAYSYDMTPWARVRNDAWEIMTTLDMGAQGIAIPKCSNAAMAQAAVDSMYYPPKGKRESNRALRFRGMAEDEYYEWARTQLMLSVSIEDLEGVENLEKILKVDGVDVITTGRGDLSLALGIPQDRNHDKVRDAQKRVLDMALAAGKQVSFTFATTKAGIEEAVYWKEQGVKMLTFEAEYRVLIRVYKEALKDLQEAIQKD